MSGILNLNQKPENEDGRRVQIVSTPPQSAAGLALGRYTDIRSCPRTPLLQRRNSWLQRVYEIFWIFIHYIYSENSAGLYSSDVG